IGACPGEVVTGSPTRTCANDRACPGERLPRTRSGVAAGSPPRTCANISPRGRRRPAAGPLMPISFSSVTSRDHVARGHGVTAVLGPTNTGKTHLAIERMLAHSSGIIGLPLRPLAREVYNKAV